MRIIETPTQQELIQFCIDLQNEISQAKEGYKSSISYLSQKFINKNNIKEGFALVVGGSHIKGSQFSWDGHSFRFGDIYTDSFNRLKNGDDMLARIKRMVPEDTTRLGINFGYPITPTPDGIDGIFIRSTKEHTISDLISKQMGAEIVSYCGLNDTKYALANDTTTLLLAGVTQFPELHIALVHGTGFNAAIRTIDNEFVNLELGGFAQFTQSRSGSFIDEYSNEPGSQLLEKEVSGQYISDHYNFYAQELGLKPIISSREVSMLAQGQGVESELANTIIDRIAMFVACVLHTLNLVTGNSTDIALVEGSVFEKAPYFQSRILETIKLLDSNMIRFISIDKSSVYGAACLALYS